MGINGMEVASLRNSRNVRSWETDKPWGNIYTFDRGFAPIICRDQEKLSHQSELVASRDPGKALMAFFMLCLV